MSDPTYPMTNAELQSAIQWAYDHSVDKTARTATEIAGDNRLVFDHLSELLKIQRERAAAAGPTRTETLVDLQRKSVGL